MDKFNDLWDWLDRRDVDKHLVSIFIMYGTWRITEWAMDFAYSANDLSSVGMAAIIAAVTAPYMALQAAAIGFYFKSRR